jgi:hypothetical protein
MLDEVTQTLKREDTPLNIFCGTRTTSDYTEKWRFEPEMKNGNYLRTLRISRKKTGQHHLYHHDHHRNHHTSTPTTLSPPPHYHHHHNHYYAITTITTITITTIIHIAATITTTTFVRWNTCVRSRF